ncbi:DUF4340 domain-containing protein, partial [bacterium]|nr:DUF4340 domain-containing protein [bacterium]
QEKGFESAVTSLVSDVIQTMIEREITEDINWSDYGLDQPEITVVVESYAGEMDSVFFGAENPTGSYLFVHKPGDPRVLLTGVNIRTALTKEVFDLRDKSVLPFELDQVQQFTLRRKGEKDIIIQMENNNWRIVQPVFALANRTIVDGIIDQIDNAQIMTFEDENPQNLNQYGLSRPEFDVMLSVGIDRIGKQFFVGKQKDTNRFYAREASRSVVFTVDSLLVGELKTPLFELRDKRIVFFKEVDIYTIEFYKQGKPDFICHKDTAGDWQIDLPVKSKAKNWRIGSFFSFLAQVEMEDFVGENISNLNQYGLHAPETAVIFKDKEGQILVHLITGKKVGDDMVYVMDKVADWICIATYNLIDNFHPNIDEYIETEETEKTEENPSS